VAVVGKRFLVLPLAFAIVGCYDSFYGPKLTNAFGFDVLVTVDYGLGQSVTTPWPACRTVFFGSKQRVVEKLVIQRDGKTLQSVTAVEMRDLTKALEHSGGSGSGMVDSTGVHLASGDATACKLPSGERR
jgi:hypothetical protein